MRYRSLSILLLLLLLTQLILPIIPVPVIEAQTEEWEIVERGVNFIRNHKVGTNTYSWESASQRIFDGSNWVPYIYEDRYVSDGYYHIQSGLIAAKIFDYYAVFYSPDMTEVRLRDERWEVQQWTGKRWSDIGAQSGTPTFIISQWETGVNITKSFTSWAGILEIKYIFREGRALKHEVVWTSSIADVTDFRVLQKWSGIVGSKVKYHEVTVYEKGLGQVEKEKTITSKEKIGGSQFRFIKEDGSLSIFENQWDMYYGYDETSGEYYVLENQNLKPVEIDIHAQGLKVDFIFGNWTLVQSESLTIDPDTATYSDPTIDGYVDWDWDANGETYTKYNNRDYLRARYDGVHYHCYTSYVEWDISGIADGSTIIDTVFKYHCQWEGYLDGAQIRETLDQRPSTAGAEALHDEAHAGTIYVPFFAGFPEESETPNLEQDLGSSADTDLANSLGVDWFGIVWEGPSTAYLCYIYSEEYGSVNPAPTLYVEYNPPTITSASISDRDDSDNCYEMNQYYTFIAVVNDLSGATDIDKVYLQGCQGTTVRFEVRATSLTGAPAYAIQTGADIIDLDTGSCSWAENGNQGTATFKIRFEWDFTDEANLELRVYVEDASGLSAGFTTKQTNYFDVIGRLVTNNFVANATYIDRGESVTLSGDVRYATTIGGDTSSSSYPPDAQFTSVDIHDAGHVERGTDAAIVNGVFSVDFDIPNAVQTNTYHVYLDLVAPYVDGDAPDGDTVVVYGINPSPINEFCDSTPIFREAEYGWVNVTVYQGNGVANLFTVDIQVNTTGDTESFTLRWTQSTNAFSEVSDDSNICALDMEKSVRENIDADEDKICFYFKITDGSVGTCDVRVTSTDDTSVTDIDMYLNEFGYKMLWLIGRLQSYALSLTAYITDSLSWAITIMGDIFNLFAVTVVWILSWFTRMINLWILLISTIKDIFDGVHSLRSGIGNVWALMNLNTWIDFVPVALFISWMLSLDARWRQTGDFWGHFIGDIQMMWWGISTIFSIAVTVIETTLSYFYRMQDLLRSLIPW